MIWVWNRNFTVIFWFNLSGLPLKKKDNKSIVKLFFNEMNIHFVIKEIFFPHIEYKIDKYLPLKLNTFGYLLHVKFSP